jgi:hypothetical protein
MQFDRLNRLHHASERRGNGFFVWIFIMVPFLLVHFRRPDHTHRFFDWHRSGKVWTGAEFEPTGRNATKAPDGTKKFQRGIPARLVWISQQIKKMRDAKKIISLQAI